MGFCGGCAKALLIVFNFIFWLSGAAILGVGVWMIVDKNIGSYFEILNIDTTDRFFKYAAYLLIAFGVFVFLVGFCGCCGAIRGSRCLLGLYIFFLVLIFAGEVAAGVLMIVYRVQIEEKIDTTLAKSIKEEYGESSSITDAWDVVQIQLECCGGKGYQDYNGSAYMKDVQTTGMLPKSCCVLTNMDAAKEKPAEANPSNFSQCTDALNVQYYHAKGCQEGLLDWAKEHANILIGVGIGIGLLQIFGIVFAICLCRQVGREDKY